MKTVPVAVRLTHEQIAKARDGLILKGIKPENVSTRSQILRLSVYLAISMNPKPKDLPSDDSLTIINQINP